ncbi:MULTISPECIES: hypothetical protein [unclassified Rathayibacter]|uniref:hypothetical protein n=1 Tax=unclassified Rathayibacter TaxID=2609250 RepID=UPI00188D1C5A|nr:MULTISPECIES: hypothetical protein [unclassified Rathayibacter]MBF4461010.1 hypothetical protein [Rathayibacter sp. VKM Ac-2879]MBF4502421.1 hypothetical protein [Rathayibacter sp. VKM Ac-2878]
MSAQTRTTPVIAGGHVAPQLPLVLSPTTTANGRDSGPLAAKEARRFVQFWKSYDADPVSRTAWADAAHRAWLDPGIGRRDVPDVDRWNDEGGADPE